MNEKLALNYFFNKFKTNNYNYYKKNKIRYVTTVACFGYLWFASKMAFSKPRQWWDETFPYDSIWGTFENNKIKTY